MIVLSLVSTCLLAVQPDMSMMRKMAEKQLKENDPVSYDVYKEKALAIKADVYNSHRIRMKILYLTSQSVPSEHFINIAHEAAESGIDVEIQPLLRGIDSLTAGYIEGYKRSMAKLSYGEQDAVRKIGAPMKVVPSLFKSLNVQTVPVLVIAKCTSSKPNLDDCAVKVIGRGTTSLRAIAIHAGLGDSARDLLRATYEMD